MCWSQLEIFFVLWMHRSKLLVVFLVTLSFINQYQSTPLDDYVNAPDPHFNWTVIHTYVEPDYKLYILNFTSQKWLDGKWDFCWYHSVYFLLKETFSSRSIWWHYMCITIPNKITRPKSGVLFIDGGSNTDRLDENIAWKYTRMTISLKYSKTDR